ncbi:glycosyltransferase family 2 protein [Mariniflexile sp.]|uniref:glycosyltransferase family 2 protein n=1 Tax=Mariniflexile sp. TaxID=1979402 RepID=UPI003568E422
MIVVYYKDKKIVDIKGEGVVLSEFINHEVVPSLFLLACKYPYRILVWCNEEQRMNLNLKAVKEVFYLKNMMISYGGNQYFPIQIGYVDFSPFLKINKKVKYPTWIMSSLVGAIYGEQLLKFEGLISKTNSLDYVLNSISKLGMPNGLFCYSEPKILKRPTFVSESPKASVSILFKFVKQHYKLQWVVVLFLCFFIYDKKTTFFSLFKSLFYKRILSEFTIEVERISLEKGECLKRNIDVVIPTLGRKKYLYDVLKDLSNQTILPKNVIIVEQNINKDNDSELDYLNNEKWPFNVKHTLINKLGVCNARNIALSQVESDWCFFGDDDIRFNKLLFEDLFNAVEITGQKVGTTVCLQQGEQQTYLKTSQTQIFGGGNSILKSDILKKVAFDTRYEFNFGEDTDFGMQIRNIGEDVIFYANIKIIHLKAQSGGYRTKVKQLWDDEILAPKPSPTIQLLYKTYFTSKQLLGYKFILGLRFYKSSSIKNPILYIKDYKKRWKLSEYWASVI